MKSLSDQHRLRVLVTAALPLLAAWGCASPSGDEPGADRHPPPFRIEGTKNWGDAEWPPGAEPTDDEKLQQIANGPDLVTALQLAAERNPRIAAARARWRAAIEKYPQAVSLPDPMVSAAPRWVEGKSGPQMWMYSFRQEIPFPTKIVLAGDIADREADIAFLQYQAALRDELVEVKEAFHELVYIEEAEETVGRVEALLQRYAAFAAGELTRGGTTLPETFRAQAQLAQLQYDRILLRELRGTEEARFRSLLLLPRNAAIGALAAPPEQPVDARLDDLQEIAEAHNEELRITGVSVNKALEELDLAKQTRIPNLAFEVEWEAPATRQEPDTLKTMVGMNLPMWESRNRAKVREAEALREAAVAERMAEHSRLEAAVARVFFRLTNAQRLIALYRDSLLPQATQAMNSAEELFRAGQASFAATLETAATWYNFQLAYDRARADHAQTLARLEQLLGATAQPVPAAQGAIDPAESDSRRGGGR